MKGPTPRRLRQYVCRRLRLKRFLEHPGDGRPQPQIPARDLIWSLLAGQILRECSFHAVEALVCSAARRALGVGQQFKDDSLAYFTARLSAEPIRAALAAVLRLAKRNKAFDSSRFIGLAVDGSAGGRRAAHSPTCELCRPRKDQDGKLLCYLHHFVMVSVVGTGLSLPFDMEPYGPGDSEVAAGGRLLRRVMRNLGRRFADYAVIDGEYAGAPFLHTVGDLGLFAVARLKRNLPELFEAAPKRFSSQPPHRVFSYHGERIEIWDADDFDPWEALRWDTVRVLRYRQHKPNGEVIEAMWLTDFPSQRLSSRSLFRIAKSRWEIENQGFNDAKNRHGLEHICHHQPKSLLATWLITILALTIERLYRLRYLRRGSHPLRTAINLVRCLRLSLCSPRPLDSS